MSKALGTDDSVTTCDCCGKVNLKFTVAIELDDGEIVHYGSTCAARNTGKAQKQIAAEIRDEKARVLKAAAAEYRSSPEHIAYLEVLSRRPRNLIGMAAYQFIAIESEAADAARARIAAKFGIAPYSLPA